MLKIGLIGCGGMGSVHANSWIALGDKVQLAAIADPRPEKAKEFCEKTGAKLYPDGEALLENEQLDIIDVCVPTFLHTRYAVAAMEKGMNVFCEKPLCLNQEEAELLLATKEKTGMNLQVGQVIRFWDEYRYVKHAAESGEFGKVLSGVFTRLSPNPKWSWENWFNDYTRSGTMALDLHVHDVDFIRYLMGREPDGFHTDCTRDADGVIQQIFTNFQYGDAVFTAEGCWDYPDCFPFSMAFRVKFEKATVTYKSDEKLKVYPVAGEAYEPELDKMKAEDKESGINVSNQGAYTNELRFFADFVSTGAKQEIAPLPEGVKSVLLALKEIDAAGGAKI